MSENTKDDLEKKKLLLEINNLRWQSKYGLILELVKLLTIPIIAVVVLLFVQYPRVELEKSRIFGSETHEKQRLLFDIIDGSNEKIKSQKIAVFEDLYGEIPWRLKQTVLSLDHYHKIFGDLPHPDPSKNPNLALKCPPDVVTALRERFVDAELRMSGLRTELVAEISGKVDGKFHRAPGYGPLARQIDGAFSRARAEYVFVRERIEECYSKKE